MSAVPGPFALSDNLEQTALARTHFYALDQSEQSIAIRSMAGAGYSELSIAAATG